MLSRWRGTVQRSTVFELAFEGYYSLINHSVVHQQFALAIITDAREVEPSIVLPTSIAIPMLIDVATHTFVRAHGAAVAIFTKHRLQVSACLNVNKVRLPF